MKETIANATITAVEAGVLTDVIARVRDTTQGPSRLILTYALQKSKDACAHTVIEEVAGDPDLRDEMKAMRQRAELRRKRKRRKMHELLLIGMRVGKGMACPLNPTIPLCKNSMNHAQNASSTASTHAKSPLLRRQVVLFPHQPLVATVSSAPPRGPSPS